MPRIGQEYDTFSVCGAPNLEAKTLDMSAANFHAAEIREPLTTESTVFDKNPLRLQA